MTKWTLHIFSKSLIAAAGRWLAVTGICIFSAVGHAKDAVKDASGRQSNEALKDLQFVTGDEEGNEVRALKTEMLVSSSEKKAVAQIKMLLKKYRNTPIEPDLWFRLAEMHMRRAKSDMFFEVHRKSETIVSLAPNVVKSASSKKNIKEAVDIYEKIQARFPRYSQLDIVLFNNAFARQQLGQDKGAEARYKQLIARYPNSFMVPDCHLAIGEMAFDRKSFKLALEHFNAIKNFPDSRVFPYGLYKAAWTHYNMRNALAGLKELEKVVEYGRFVVQNNIDARLDLRREALGDMTLFFEDVYSPTKAWSYFGEQAKGLDVAPVILKLSNLYKRHSRFNDVNVVLTDFIKNLPYSALRPEVENEMIWSHENLKKRDLAVQYMESMYKVCDPKGRWTKEQKASSTVANAKGAAEPFIECQELLEKTSLSLAKKWYKFWRNHKDMVDLAVGAEKSFEIYLRRAKPTDEAFEARFAYAELLFKRDKFREASENYAIVGTSSNKVELSHDALYSSLLSIEKAVKDKWSDEDEKRFVFLVKEYTGRHSKGKYRLDLEFKMALIAYEKGRYADASPIFERLGREFDGEDRGIKAQDLYLDILNIQKNYTALKNYAAKLKTGKKLGERKEKLTKIYEQAYFMEVQDLAEKNKHLEAIKGYKEFAGQNKSSTLAEQAWWNALQLHFKILDFPGGAEAAESFYEQFPKSSRSVEALLRAAQTYEDMAQLDRASKVLMDLAVADAKSAHKWKSLAADFLVLTGNEKQAVVLYESLQGHQDQATAFHALQQMELISRAQPTSARRRLLLKRIAESGQQPQSSLAQLAQLEEVYSSKDYSQAFIDAKKIVGAGGQASIKARARARFIQAEILEQEFLHQSVKARAERIAVVLALKTEKLEKAQKAYQAAIQYGDPEISVKSLEKLSDLYSHYVESLRQMPSPAGLEAAEEAAFRQEMEKLAIPLEEKSVETLAQALASAQKMRLRNGSVAQLQSKLNKANMVKEEVIDYKVHAPAAVLPEFLSEVGS
ncbi:MAG: tetratricopeptide repeat protein [Bdellovibrionaceae bacterium]|nr:tetratricopeptide repeat protein [Bdellovibrionales bacterium]MCB9084731.1 tetratricopeptide repeat protein [Pseudobdellovibrionaceae bacterium]